MSDSTKTIDSATVLDVSVSQNPNDPPVEDRADSFGTVLVPGRYQAVLAFPENDDDETRVFVLTVRGDGTSYAIEDD